MKGFILNSETYIDRGGASMDETQLYGVLSDGRNFSWKQTPAQLKAFLPQTVELPQQHYHAKSSETFVDYDGTPLSCYHFASLSALKAARQAFPKLVFLESELGSLSHLLIAKQIKGGVEFLSEPASANETLVTFENPDVRAATVTPNLTAVSIDIETGVDSNLLYSIALYGEKIAKVLILDPDKKCQTTPALDFSVLSLPTEKALLQCFLSEMHTLNPQLIMGWNIVGFDFTFLLRKYEQYELPFTLGIGQLPVIHYKRKGRDIQIRIPGRVFCEGMDITKQLAPPLANYKLDTAAATFLNEQKTITLTGLEKVKEIDKQFARDKPALARYNLKDAELVYRLMEKFAAVPFLIGRVQYCGVLMEQLKYSAEITQFAMLSLMRRKKLISPAAILETTAPLPNEQEQHAIAPQKTGPVSCIMLATLLPLTILRYKLDPYGLWAAKTAPANVLHTPTGFAFHRHKHFLPFIIERTLELLSKVPPTRSVERQVLSITLQQLIDGITTNTSRFAQANLTKAIQENALHLVKKITSAFKQLGAEILYYDTHIILVKHPAHTLSLSAPASTQASCLSAHQEFIAELLTKAKQTILPEIFAEIKRTPQLSLAAHYKQIFIPAQSFTLLKNKSALQYFALDLQERAIRCSREYHRLHFTLAGETALIDAYLREQPIAAAIANLKRQLLNGQHDASLVYKKKLTKPLHSYDTAGNIPPHIAAARQIPDIMQDKNIHNKRPYIHYLLTTKGGEPAATAKHPPAYHDYWQKELVPTLKNTFAQTSIASIVTQELLSEDHELSLF